MNTFQLRMWLALFLGFAVLVGGGPAFGTIRHVSPGALIVYDSWQQIPVPTKADRLAPDASLADAQQLANLLGHFPIPARLVSLNDYRPGMLESYQYGFYIGTIKKAVLPAYFLADVRRDHGKFCWLNYGFGQLGASFLARQGLAYEGLDLSPGFKQVRYHNIILNKGDITTTLVRVINPSRCDVLAVALRGQETVPYIMRTGDFWFVADSPFSFVGDRDRYFAYTDTLFDFLDVKQAPRKRAIIRVEDINVTTPPKPLMEIADHLSALHAPFVMSVIPQYINPAEHRQIAMKENPKYVDALHYMTRHGGSVVMHGDTHQYHGVSADDYEFWDGENERALPTTVDTPDYVTDHLRRGLTACFDSFLFPVAWETPHYAASVADYSVIARHFSTAIEQRTLLNDGDFSQCFPFEIQKDTYGQHLYPENLGYVPMQHIGDDQDKPEDIAREEAEVDKILANARDLGVLRDVTVGVFIHPFLNTDLVSKLVVGLQKEGYTFIDLRQADNKVQLGDMLVGTGKIQGTVDLDKQYLHEFFVDPQGHIRRTHYSDRKLSGTIGRSLTTPSGWIYVCVGARELPPSWSEKAQRELLASLSRTANSLSRNSEETPEPKDPADTLLLCLPQPTGGAKHDQQSFFAALSAMGASPEQLTVDKLNASALDKYNVLVVPQASALALSPDQVKMLVDETRRGLNILFDGDSPLARALGITFTGTYKSVTKVDDLLTTFVPPPTPSQQQPQPQPVTLRWDVPVKAPVCTYPSDATVVYRNADASHQPLGVFFNYHQGHCLALATPFDIQTSFGYSHYPTMPTAFYSAFPVIPAFAAHDLELYFDPSYRPKVLIEKLVLDWKKWGVRAVHVATWIHRPGWDFDYANLIKNCHANGIAVYAWLELPYVSPNFYNDPDHLKWHEKTATGADANPGWRMPVAIEEPECRKEVIRTVTGWLNQYDWDGVNLSELYFENAKGPDDPANFVPMHPYVRETFKRRYGFDPAELCQSNSAHYWRTHADDWQLFTEFRREMLLDVYHDLLVSFEPFRKGNGVLGHREVVVTALDTLNNQEIARNTGLDIRDLLGMMSAREGDGERRFDFTLNVEDPAIRWSDPPDRYRHLGDQYRRLVPDPAKLALDLNFVDCHQIGQPGNQFATAMPVGIETLELMRTARQAAPRVIIYSEKTLSSYNNAIAPTSSDQYLIASASAAAGSWSDLNGGYALQASGTLVMQGQDEDNRVAVGQDDSSIVNKDGQAILPAGTHALHLHDSLFEMAAASIPKMHLLNLTGTLQQISMREGVIRLTYQAKTPCLITVDQQPVRVWVDGQPWHEACWEGTDSWTVRCPSGRHQVMLTTESPSLFIAQAASAYSSWLIVIVGTFASLTLLVLLLLTHLSRRRRQRVVEGAPA